MSESKEQHDRLALEYHRRSPSGKIEVIPSKPCVTQRDLSLAYTPGVAAPCLEIARDPSLAAEFTGRANLVGGCYQWVSGVGARQYWRVGVEAGDGGQGGPL